jgi:elongation factor G
MEAAQNQGRLRQTIMGTAEATGRYVKQTCGPGIFAIVRLRVEPLAGSDGVEFINTLSEEILPSEFVKFTEQGVRQTLAQGIQEGVPVVAVRVTLVDGRYHEVDSRLRDFEVAGALAVKEAVRQAQPIVIELDK